MYTIAMQKSIVHNWKSFSCSQKTGFGNFDNRKVKSPIVYKNGRRLAGGLCQCRRKFFSQREYKHAADSCSRINIVRMKTKTCNVRMPGRKEEKGVRRSVRNTVYSYATCTLPMCYSYATNTLPMCYSYATHTLPIATHALSIRLLVLPPVHPSRPSCYMFQVITAACRNFNNYEPVIRKSIEPAIRNAYYPNLLICVMIITNKNIFILG